MRGVRLANVYAAVGGCWLHGMFFNSVQARTAWEKFPPPARRAWVDFLAQNKKPDQRARRISEALARIALGKTP